MQIAPLVEEQEKGKSMKNCLNCHTDNPDTAKYCKQCGCKLRMGMKDAVEICFDNYATFSGRASRSEFWYFALFSCICLFVVSFMASIVDALMLNDSDRGILCLFVMFLCQIVFFLPLISVSVRRLHDIGLNGLWNLLFFTQLLFFNNKVVDWLEDCVTESLREYTQLFCFALFYIIFIFVFRIKSSQGYNKYGNIPIC